MSTTNSIEDRKRAKTTRPCVDQRPEREDGETPQTKVDFFSEEALGSTVPGKRKGKGVQAARIDAFQKEISRISGEARLETPNADFCGWETKFERSKDGGVRLLQTRDTDHWKQDSSRKVILSNHGASGTRVNPTTFKEKFKRTSEGA